MRPSLIIYIHTYIERYHKNDDEFRNHIVQLTGDETWFSVENVEIARVVKAVGAHTFTKQAEKVYTKRCLPARNLMATVFWDRQGVLMVEFMQNGTAIMQEVYCETPKVPHRAIQNKWRGMLKSSVLPLPDNVRLHTAAHI
jgi:hypothetical protein